jgi:hypothetical protein
MKTLTLRGIEAELETALKSESDRQGASLSATIITILRRSFGLAKPRYHREYHDLDQLAGTWTQEDRAEFEKNTSAFSRIDKDMWS